MLSVCVEDVMDVVFSVCIVRRGADCRCSCMGSVSVLSCRCCMFVSYVHPVSVLNAAFCMTCILLMLVVVVRLPRPMEGNGVTPIFRSLQNCQFHHRRLESLEHFNVLDIYIYILRSTTVLHFCTLRMPYIFLQGLPFLYTFPFLQVHFACVLCI